MRLLVFFSCLVFATLLHAHEDSNRVEGRLIIQLAPNVNVVEWSADISAFRSNNGLLKFIKTIFKQDNVQLFQFEESEITFEKIKTQLENLSSVRYVQGDYAVSLRNTPNDPMFFEQWPMDLIKATEVWDVTTGGQTIEGDEIVVAVIDDGFDPLHEDLVDNVWVNEDEIPGDNIDNDSNGYIDDYYGLNVRTGNDQHFELNHGTQTSGIIGAKGNNGIGVAGVNWDIKLMLISGIRFDSEIIEAYQYALNERNAYNSTNGNKGSFVVATNSSFGIDEEFPDSHGAWCQTYNTLGEAGILSVCSTTNLGIDVDLQGDMPSNCISPYLISVTNTDQQDTKVTSSGFGNISIDLGAPGDDTFTTELSDTYGVQGGTSSASPHVTGAIGLLYSAPCEAFIEFVKSDPSQAALSLKSAILEGVDPLPSLDGITTTGGRLNIFNSLLNIGDFCEASSGDLEILTISPNPVTINEVSIEYETPDFEEYELVVYSTIGKVLYYESIIPPLFSKKITTVNTEEFPTGVYYICIYSDSDKVCSSFFVL